MACLVECVRKDDNDVFNQTPYIGTELELPYVKQLKRITRFVVTVNSMRKVQ